MLHIRFTSFWDYERLPHWLRSGSRSWCSSFISVSAVSPVVASFSAFFPLHCWRPTTLPVRGNRSLSISRWSAPSSSPPPLIWRTPPSGVRGGSPSTSTATARSASSSTSIASTTISISTPVAISSTPPSLTRITHLYSTSGSTDPCTIQGSGSVFSIPGILHLNESKTWRLSCYPDISDRAVFAEDILNIVSVGIITKSSDEDLAFRVPFSMSRHLVFVVVVGMNQALWWDGNLTNEASLCLG